MKTTAEPLIIYDVFEKYGFPTLRIDEFEGGKNAKIRVEMNHGDFMTVKQLLELSYKLNLIERNEKIAIRVVNIDLIHKTMRLDLSINVKSS